MVKQPFKTGNVRQRITSTIYIMCTQEEQENIIKEVLQKLLSFNITLLYLYGCIFTHLFLRLLCLLCSTSFVADRGMFRVFYGLYYFICHESY